MPDQRSNRSAGVPPAVAGPSRPRTAEHDGGSTRPRSLSPSVPSVVSPAVPKPETGSRKSKPELNPQAVRANIRNILLANPLFPKFYADTVIATRPNSKLAKALQLAYPKILDQVKSNMATHTCTHIKATGVRCGSPALRGEQFCYFHQRMHRGVRTPPQARLHPIANFEDEESIQLALMEVTNALMRNTIDLKRASLILRALHIAVKNAARVHYKIYSSNMVKEVPQYADPTLQDAQRSYDMGLPGGLIPRVRTAAERRAQGDYHPPENPTSRDEMLAQYFGYPSVEAYLQAEKEKKQKAEAEKSKAMEASQPRVPHPSRFSKGGNSDTSGLAKSATSDSPRKPPASMKAEASVKEEKGSTIASAPKERKIAAHGASRG
jgi:hypothetical protein